MFGAIDLVDDLVCYASAEQALDGLVGGHTFSLSNGLDPSKAGLPGELSEWICRRIG